MKPKPQRRSVYLCGVSEPVGFEDVLPLLLRATTVHVYFRPLVSDRTVKGDDAPTCEWLAPPLLDLHATV